MDFNNLFFVVGSPRSGTKIFRDTLRSHPDVTATDHPLEEIWSSGHEDSEVDAYPPQSLTSQLTNSIRKAFASRIEPNKIFVEKNVRNSLRIPYIREVFPEAKFIHIIRNPLDVVVSLRKRWRNPIDWDYYLSSKALEISPRDIVYYGAKLGWKFFKRLVTGQNRVDIWGPHYPALRDDLSKRSLIEVCALQWKACVSEVRRHGPRNQNDYFELRYETLMRQPSEELNPLGDFLGLEDREAWLDFARRNFRSSSIDRWKSELTSGEIDKVESIVGSLRTELNYELSCD